MIASQTRSGIVRTITIIHVYVYLLSRVIPAWAMKKFLKYDRYANNSNKKRTKGHCLLGEGHMVLEIKQYCILTNNIICIIKLFYSV